MCDCLLEDDGRAVVFDVGARVRLTRAWAAAHPSVAGWLGGVFRVVEVRPYEQSFGKHLVTLDNRAEVGSGILESCEPVEEGYL